MGVMAMRSHTRLTLLCVLLVPALVAASKPLPAPQSALGFKPARITVWRPRTSQSRALRKLAASTPYIKIVEAGRTTQGRAIFYALVSIQRTSRGSTATARSRGGSRIPRGLTDEQARRSRARAGPWYLDGGCHATEVAVPR
jgi:hypothetical protein